MNSGTAFIGIILVYALLFAVMVRAIVGIFTHEVVARIAEARGRAPGRAAWRFATALATTTSVAMMGWLVYAVLSSPWDF